MMRSTDSTLPLRRTPVRMAGAVEQLPQRVDRADGRVVLVLPQRGDRLGAPLVDLARPETRAAARRRASDREDVGEILGQAGAGQRQPWRVGRHPQRHAAIVELLGNGVGRPRAVPRSMHAADE